MTKPRYLKSCAAGSQECGDAANPADYAWNVNFNNGNVNNNNQNNTGFVRAVRRVAASEYRGVAFSDVYRAWKRARRRKKPSTNQMHFEANLGDNLVRLVDQLNACTWSPSPSTLFIASNPKSREIHAPDFSDRVVHHWLVPLLEILFERRFIHHSYSNRKGKGTHAAVDALRGFVHQVQSGQGSGWFLQLDISNFFNAIHRPTLYAQLKCVMERDGLSQQACHAVHALLRHSPLAQGVIHRATPAQRATVPAHKRLENAALGCGLPIGNLSSQFFANVYLDALDQFVKHTLKAKRYLRYVDDFVLVHEHREQLLDWQHQIEAFLRDHLRLALKPDIRLRPLAAGIDFLGYVIYPTHTRVRRRVVAHAREKLSRFGKSPEHRQQAAPIWASYQGHFSHANAWRLQSAFQQRYECIA